MKSRNITTKEILATVLACTCFDFSVIGMDKNTDAKKAALQFSREHAPTRSTGYETYFVTNNKDVENLVVNEESFEELHVTGEITVPLDLSKCKNLKYLVIRGIISEPLDLSKCKKLRTLIIIGELNGIIFPIDGGTLGYIEIHPEAEITGELDLTHCAALGKVVIKKELEGILTLPQNANITGRCDFFAGDGVALDLN
jgi:hypothetical protein